MTETQNKQTVRQQTSYSSIVNQKNNIKKRNLLIENDLPRYKTKKRKTREAQK